MQASTKIYLNKQGGTKIMNMRLKLYQPQRLNASDSLRKLLQEGRLLAAAETSSACSKAIISK
jgi:hypothetical protein